MPTGAGLPTSVVPGQSSFFHVGARIRSGPPDLDDPSIATRTALRPLARRYEVLTAAIADVIRADRD
jgi:hypothetical protein